MSSDSDMVVKRLSVPMGLEELMESLTKEVLRRKPSDIYAFASEHFAQLLEIRDQGNMRGISTCSYKLEVNRITVIFDDV